MNIYDVNKLLSSQNKSRLIAHFWDCHCLSHDVNHLVSKLKTTQSNLSKHINALLKENVLQFEQKGKERFYRINKAWKRKWKEIIQPQMENPKNKIFKCNCNLCGIKK